MTSHSYVKHVADSIAKAERLESNLDAGALAVPGMTSPKVRHLLNNLGGLNWATHLEVGVHRGATFVATNYKNSLVSTGVDNFSQFATPAHGDVRLDFHRNVSKFLAPSVRFLEKDCLAVTAGELPGSIDLFVYDGDHEEESHYNALRHFYPMLAHTFILVVDDFSWEGPREGTWRALNDLAIKSLAGTELEGGDDDAGRLAGWWNGVYVGVLQK